MKILLDTIDRNIKSQTLNYQIMIIYQLAFSLKGFIDKPTFEGKFKSLLIKENGDFGYLEFLKIQDFI